MKELQIDRVYWYIFQTSYFPIRKILLPLGTMFLVDNSDKVKSFPLEDSECSWSWFSLLDIRYKMNWKINFISESEIATEEIILNIESILFLEIEKYDMNWKSYEYSILWVINCLTHHLLGDQSCHFHSLDIWRHLSTC